MSSLARLAAAVDDCHGNVPIVRVGGIVREVSPSHYRVSGLSRFVSLGERIRFEGTGRPSIGEVVQIDEAGATVKSFDNDSSVGIGDFAFRVARKGLAPSDALDRPRHRRPRRAHRRWRSAAAGRHHPADRRTRRRRR